MKKLFSIFLCMALIITISTASAAAEIPSNPTYCVIEQIESVISVENNQFVLDLSEVNKLLTSDEIELLVNHLEKVNNIIMFYNVDSVSVKDGFVLHFPNSNSNFDVVGSSEINGDFWTNSAPYEGITKVIVRWYGYEVWLSRSVVQGVIVAGTAGGLYLASLIPLVGLAFGNSCWCTCRVVLSRKC